MTAHADRRVLAVLLAGVLATAGCASAARAGLNSRLIRHAKGSPAAPAPFDTGVPADSLETTIAKIRELSARARPVSKHSTGPTIESLDGRLAAALLALRAWSSAATHRQVALEYTRLRILDQASWHYRAALRFDPQDGAAYDGLARIWRDWRLPGLALSDAHRAVYYAPRSAEAHNTLGTVLHALGRRAEAKESYRRSLTLDPGAAYAANNLGYVLLLEGDRAAVGYFRHAIAIDGELIAARHNLALAYAAAGRLDLARLELRAADPQAAADYNFGIISLSRRDRAAALAAFDAACRARAGVRWACERYSQLSAAAAAAEEIP